MWTERIAGTTAGTRISAACGAIIATLAALCVLGAFGFPGKGGIFAPLGPDAPAVTRTGIVKGAPRGAPLAGATVCSDKELCLTDAQGFFSLSSGKDAVLHVEASGYQPLRLAPRDEQPLIILLFPEGATLDKSALGIDN